MAEAVLSALVHLMVEKSTSQVLQEYGSLSGTKKEMQKLQSTLSTIQAVLEDAEGRQVTDKAVKSWLVKLKDVAYEADDLLDEYLTEALRRKSEIHDQKEIRSCIIDKVRCFFSRSNPILFCYRMKYKLEKVVERLNAVADERFKYHLRDEQVDWDSQSSGRLQSDSFLLESEVLGRDDDKGKIVKLLLDSSSHDVTVLPIVGMGGLGKTTLAKLVYNDERVGGHFDQRIWVCVSEDFDVKRLMRAIIESVTGNACNLLEMDAVNRRLQELIMGQRFLLVLDDVWNDDHGKWDRLKASLRCGCKGSKIVVTTRSERVALVMGTVSFYHLEGLANEDCWSLFKDRAFRCRRPEDSSELLTIGKEIARKCRGVPLAAESLGSLMSMKRQKSEWLFVRDCEIWNLMEEENGILPVLRLSYDNLPSYLKQCFAYCSLFPKDYVIKKENIIYLWIAEGFVQWRQRKSLEENGEEYFNALLWRSFFQCATKDSNGSTVEFKMHHLLHDLAKHVAGRTCLTVEVDRRVHVPAGTRHLSVVCNDNKILKGVTNAGSLHSFLLLYGRRKIEKVPHGFISSFKSLRSLDLSSAGIKKLSKSIGLLQHLRYLDLSNSLFKSLPNSICSLFNLHTFILMHCNRLETLPRDMRKLVNLRHLLIHGCGSLTRLPAGIGELKSLKTLPIFIVDKGDASSIAELRSFDLHGELKIKNLEDVGNARCARNANLKEKRNLLSLILLWGQNEVNVREDVESVIEGLEPHSDLKKLRVENYMGSRFPSWLMNSGLINLVELSIIECPRCVQLPPLGKLPKLEVLVIDGVDAVMYFCDESRKVASYVSLKQLKLKNMPNLLGWSQVEGTNSLPQLKELSVDSCPNLATLPNLPSLESLELYDCSAEILTAATKFISLSNFVIGGFSELKYLPEGLLRNKRCLSSFEIRDCEIFRHFSGELKSVSTLQSLTISNCHELESLSELESLQSLKSLFIGRCNSLVTLPDEGITGLQSLTYFSLSNCDNLAALPGAMQHLTALQTLHIWGCPKLDTLPEWMGKLTSLQELELWYCENLRSLPESMQDLTALQILSIWNCPLLDILCEKEVGENWRKIRHIPFIKINGPYIQALNS